jgi:hypothetical protein
LVEPSETQHSRSRRICPKTNGSPLTATSPICSRRPIPRSMRRWRPPLLRACSRTRSRPTRASCSPSWPGPSGRAPSWRSARSARALPPGGTLVTLEIDPRCAGVARANVARAGLTGIVEVRVGRALDTLPRLVAEGRGPFDLVFIDADKPNYAAYLDWALKLTRRGSLIVADNVVRDGAVADAHSSDPSVQGVRRFIAALAAEPRVSATVVQTVGSKGYDGFAIALVTGD